MKIAVSFLTLASLTLSTLLPAPSNAQDQAVAFQAAAADGFVPLFNGKDLTGWHNVNCAPTTFFVKEGMIITTGVPTGYLRTDKQYENFILEFEWFHAPKPKGSVGNSGLFVWGDPLPAVGSGYTRGIEVQVLVNLTWKDKAGKLTATSQGDLFSIWGAKCKPDRPHPSGWERCLPSEDNCKGEHEWNHYSVVANNGVIKLTVNGKEVSGVSECKPRKGYLALESEGSECRFRNLKIKELPTTNPKPEECADVDKGFKCMFTGVDLAGWKVSEDKAPWKVNDGVVGLGAVVKGESALWSEKSYGDFELVCDWRFTVEGWNECAFYVRGNKHEIALKTDKKGTQWHRSILRLKGDRVTLRTDGKIVAEDVEFRNLPKTGAIALVASGQDGPENLSRVAVQFRNAFIRELKANE
jgi:Domain of Unknown Function (DUF1080)